MTSRLLLCLLFGALSAVNASAQQPGNQTVATADGRLVDIEFINDYAVRVTNRQAGTQREVTGLTVNLEPAFTGTSTTTPTGLSIASAIGLKVAVDNATGRVAISDTNGLILTDDGTRTLTDGLRTLTLTPARETSFYGGGERGYSLNLAGDTLVGYNKQNYGYVKGEPRIKQMNITMPMVLSSDGWALIFDDYAPSTLILGNPITYTTEAQTPVSFIFVMSADKTLADLTRRLSAITGRQDLAPLWSLGYITSKYGYKTEAEAREVIATLKEKGFPVDGIVFDLYWYGKEEDMGRLAWDPEQWPTHRAMLDDFNRQGVKTVLISQPYVLTNGRAKDNYDLLSDKSIFVNDIAGGLQDVKIWVGEGAMFDVSSPAARQWLTDRYRGLTAEGVGGWWGDLGEPEVHPESGIHANGKTARLYHNKYGNDWSSIIYDLYKADFPDTRLMTLMRGGTIGLQRYSVFPWSTDVSRSWGGLQPQVTIMLNSGLSGLGYMSHDVGGFAIDPENPVDPELYVRWLQLGLYSPVLRTHAQETAEPYLYPEQADIILPLIKERYRMLPYNYTRAWENASLGTPLVRPVSFYKPGDRSADTIEDEYLWGPDILVAPVLTQGANSRRVVFPEGRWVDLRNPQKVYGEGEAIDYPAPLDVIPLFVRAGAFLPTADYEMANTCDYRTDTYTINYYPADARESESVVFEDNLRSTTSLSDGEYLLMNFRGSETDSAITIDIESEGSYAGMPELKKFDLKVYGIERPKAVTVNGREILGHAQLADSDVFADSILSLPTITWKTGTPLKIVITK